MIINPYEDYKRRLDLALKTAKRIEVNEEKYKLICNFGEEYVKDKGNVPHYAKDPNEFVPRVIGGHMGEAAMEDLLEIEIVNTDPTFSYDKNVPDLHNAGIITGVKTHKKPNPPLLNFVSDNFYNSLTDEKKKDHRYPQVILSWDISQPRVFYMLGVFAPSVLFHKDYLAWDLIWDPKLAARRAKVPFIGVDRGIQFDTVEELKNIVGETWKIKST